MRTAYDPLRHAHVESVQAGLADHIGRLAWPRERIENYRDRRLRALLVYAAQRSPFHARRLADLNLSGVSVADLGALPSMTKAQAQENWDSIVTIPGLHRDDVETILLRSNGIRTLPAAFRCSAQVDPVESAACTCGTGSSSSLLRAWPGGRRR